MTVEKPTHVGFIMDGNRRWAKKRGLTTYQGHKAGSDALEKTIGSCLKEGIKHATFYAFSVDNWKRSEREIEGLMKVFELICGSFQKKWMNKNVKFVALGDISKFKSGVRRKIEETETKTRGNSGMTVNVALNYGGRMDIVRAVKKCQEKGEEITELSIIENLYTSPQPDPDFIVRTGGEMRLSGFLTWQSTYSELYFTHTAWPDFDDKEFAGALNEYAERKRNYGK